MVKAPGDPLTLLLSSASRASYRHVLPLIQSLAKRNHESHLVGGGVRDLLLARPVQDWDLATNATPEEVIAIWPHAVPTGIRHGTVSVHTELGMVEITTYRTEGAYSDGRRPDWVRFDVSLEQDLARRDFTINAMALDPMGETFVDPVGGLNDLGEGIIRTVGDADQRFSEDGLRPLRGIRFAAVLEFSVERLTLEAMARARDHVARVSMERVRDEWIKLLGARVPSVGVELLRETGLLDLFFPELLEGVGMSQNRYHAHDVYKHTLLTLDQAPRDNLRVRLAALLHDVGKPRTRKIVDGEGSFYDHENVGAKLTKNIMERLKFSRSDREHVTHLVKQHMFHYTEDWSDAAVRRFMKRVGVEFLDDLFELRQADVLAHGAGGDASQNLGELERRIRAVQAREEAVTVADLAITGQEIMQALKLGPGPKVGQILNDLLEQVLEDPDRNTEGRLLELARERHSQA